MIPDTIELHLIFKSDVYIAEYPLKRITFPNNMTQEKRQWIIDRIAASLKEPSNE